MSGSYTVLIPAEYSPRHPVIWLVGEHNRGAGVDGGPWHPIQAGRSMRSASDVRELINKCRANAVVIDSRGLPPGELAKVLDDVSRDGIPVYSYAFDRGKFGLSRKRTHILGEWIRNGDGPEFRVRIRRRR